MTSVSDALEEDSISDEELGYIITPLPDFMVLAQDIQNRGAHRIGTDNMEALHFCDFFGTSVLIVEKVWDLLERDSLLPERCEPKHLLWSLHFMKVYPKQSTGCSAVGASDGAVDPKTHQKWVWVFICYCRCGGESIIMTLLLLLVLNTHTPSQPQIIFESRLGPHPLHNESGWHGFPYSSAGKCNDG